MPRRLALAVCCALTLLPSAWRALAARPAAPRACTPQGKGVAPRHWVGCAADPGPPRALTGSERVLLGVPIDLDTATPEDLACVPGLSAKLALEVVADRARRGPFTSPDDLMRVRGVGPTRLARARPFLTTGR